MTLTGREEHTHIDMEDIEWLRKRSNNNHILIYAKGETCSYCCRLYMFAFDTQIFLNEGLTGSAKAENKHHVMTG